MSESAHYDTVMIAGILHRDVSLGNLVLSRRCGPRSNHRRFMHSLSTEQQDSLCKKIDHLLRRGVLVDWGYAVPVALPSTPIDDSFLGNGPPTSPIEPIGVSDTPSDYIPIVNVGLRDKSTSQLIPMSELSPADEIVLLMGPSDPADDPQHTIDASPLHRTVRILFIDFINALI